MGAAKPRNSIRIGGKDILHRARMAGKAIRNPVQRAGEHARLKRQRAINSLKREFGGIKIEEELRQRLKQYLIHTQPSLARKPESYFTKRINRIIAEKTTSPTLSLYKIAYQS